MQGTIGTLEVNETYYAFILGFDHNYAIEGRGISFGTFKTAKTDGLDVALVDSIYNTTSTDGTKCFNMNHNGNTNTDGWQGCDLRFDILGSVDTNNAQNASANTPTNPVSNTLMAALPVELREVLKPVTKYTDNYGGSNENDPTKVTTTVDYLPLLSEYEVFGAKTYSNDNEQNYQEQYGYFRNGNSQVKQNGDSANVRWWGRSNHFSSSTFFTIVNFNGSPSYNSSSYSAGLSPIFLI